MNRIVSQRTYIQLAVLATITILVFYSIVKQFDIGAVPQLLAHTQPLWIVVGVLMGFVTSPFLNTLRWQSILTGAGHRVAFKKIFLITLINWPFMVLPGRLGDLLKSYPLRNEVPVSHSIASIVTEKIIDILSLLGIIIVGSLLLKESRIAVITTIIFAGALIGLAITQIVSLRVLVKIIPQGKMRDTITHFTHILQSLIHRKKYLFLAIISSSGNWLTNIFAVFCFYKSFGITVPFAAILTYLPLSIFVGLIPVTIAGMGTRDAALIQFFRDYASAGQSLSVGILYSLSAYWLPVIIGLCVMYGTELRSSLWPHNLNTETEKKENS